MNLIVASDKTKINAPIAMAVKSSLAITGASAIILLAVLYLILSRTFLSKLKALTEGTNAFQHGDLSYRLPQLGNDELGLLASTFNVMGESLQKAALELELKVEERTNELKIANESLLKQIEERKKAEEALAQETSLLSGLLDSVPDIVFFKDKKGVYSGCNPEFSRFVGRDRAQIIGHTDYDLFEKELADSFCNNDRIMMQQAKARRNEEWIDYPDGRRRLIDTYKAPLRSANGDTIGVLGVSRDITERKRIEEDLLESEENFRTFFETMDDIIVVATPDGKMIYSNPAASRKLGYDPEELKAMHVLDLHPEAKRQEAERIFAEMFRGERDVCPLPLAKKDGAYLPVETRVWFGKWSGKDCIFGICKDLSKEQEALQKFNRIFDSNPALMALSSYPERKFTEVNNAFVSAMGFSREEVIGKTSKELGLFVEPETERQAAQALQDQGSVRNIEMKVRKKNGTIAEGLFFGEIIDNQGQKRLLSVMTDITELKKTERKLAELNERLEEKVAERSDELVASNRQLLFEIQENTRIQLHVLEIQKKA